MAKGSWVVFLGLYPFSYAVDPFNHQFFVLSFGLLHRIPPQPAEPGLPPELQEDAEEYNEQHLFDADEMDQPNELGVHGHHQDNWRQEFDSENFSASSRLQLRSDSNDGPLAPSALGYDEADEYPGER